MPEGDTVHLAATRLDQALAGQRLVATDFRMPAIATADLAGQVVREVVARGKHLLLRTDAGVTLHSHLKMEGAWHLYRPAERWRGPGWQVRAVLRTERWVAVGFRLGVCELLPTAREHEVVGHLGPDVLGPDWDPVEAARRLRAERARAIGTALLDQRPARRPGGHARPAGADDGGQPLQRHPGHHRRPAPRPLPLGARPRRPALPPLRHPGPQGRPGEPRRRPGHLLVPDVPARARTREPIGG